MADSLTPEQIKNWRNALVGMIGPYAPLMSDSDRQMMCEQMQENFNEQIERAEEPTNSSHAMPGT